MIARTHPILFALIVSLALPTAAAYAEITGGGGGVISKEVTIGLDVLVNGVAPNPNTPWAIADFMRVAPTQIELSLTANNLLANQTISQWFFTYTGSAALTISPDPINPGAAQGATIEQGNIPLFGVGVFNLGFLFDGLTNTDTALFLIQSDTKIPLSDFLGSSSGGVLGSYVSIARVVSSSTGISRIGAVVSAPEPMTYIALATGLALVAAASRRRKTA